MKRSEFVTNELIDKNLRHLQETFETQRNRLSKYNLIDLESDSLLSNVRELLCAKLESHGYINIHGEIITIEESLIELNKNGGWLSKIEIDKQIDEKIKTEQNTISNLEIKKLIAETVKAEYDAENIKSSKRLSIIAIIVSISVFLFEIIKWSIEIYKSSIPN
jgi:hypothetical protein